jgi:hypothetical protein
VTPIIFIEFNEINFDFVRRYTALGKLPNFRRMIEQHGISETTSEESYSHLEPWIQWVTAHTGKPFGDHRVFRLGDFVNSDAPQIWEQLERCGLKVGAISPMNATNRLREPAFFVPDPWTSTRVAAPPVLERLYRAIVQAVNDNAQGKLAKRTVTDLLAGFLRYASPSNYLQFAKFAGLSGRRPWYRAMFLDLLLADVFLSEQRRTRPDFSTLFLNAGAHIQHHYLFSSACYAGPHRNPAWYVPAGVDPVYEAYALYDRIVGQVQAAFPRARIMVATGLHQDPHDRVTWYWRLRDHADFLSRIRVPFGRVEPRMSRDFLVVCQTDAQAMEAGKRLAAAISRDGRPIFAVDNRGTDLFVELAYDSEIGPGFEFTIDGETFGGLDRDVAFVALKNGRHNGIGYFLDSAAKAGTRAAGEFPLAQVHARILEALAQPA